jgi:hypothetical protein
MERRQRARDATTGRQHGEMIGLLREEALEQVDNEQRRHDQKLASG